MKRRHFEVIAPVCAVCKQAGVMAPLTIARVIDEHEADILEGILQCSRAECKREYPILDGIPLLIPGLRAYVAQNILPLLRRDDLSSLTESILGDCCGPGSAFDQMRQHLSSYVWGHYSDMDPTEPEGSRPSVVEILKWGVDLAGEPGPGPILDIGCSVGRSTFELAERHDRLVLGIDLSFAMLKVASRALRAGEIRYDRRRIGLVYHSRSFPVGFRRSPNVDFWACDAQSLPFLDGTFSFACSLNLLDCLQSPHDHLVALSRVLVPGGRVAVSTPYDWSPAATPIEGWIGGHSQRGPEGGSSASALRALLTPGAHPASVEGLELVAECDSLSFRVRLHERSVIEYAAHLVVAERPR